MRDVSNAYRDLQIDPMMVEVTRLIRESNRTKAYIARKTGISAGTFKNWETKRTKRPQRVTLEFALRALGYRMTIERRD